MGGYELTYAHWYKIILCNYIEMNEHISKVVILIAMITNVAKDSINAEE